MGNAGSPPSNVTYPKLPAFGYTSTTLLVVIDVSPNACGTYTVNSSPVTATQRALKRPEKIFVPDAVIERPYCISASEGTEYHGRDFLAFGVFNGVKPHHKGKIGPSGSHISTSDSQRLNGLTNSTVADGPENRVFVAIANALADSRCY
jgi:hypothetical protein